MDLRVTKRNDKKEKLLYNTLSSSEIMIEIQLRKDQMWSKQWVEPHHSQRK
jgi:hypothetical protein